MERQPFSESRRIGQGWNAAEIDRDGVNCSACDKMVDVSFTVYWPDRSWNKGYCEGCARAKGAPVPEDV